jgi:hypothetical protein
MKEMSRTFKQFQTRGRFVVEPSENIPGGWMLVDTLDGCLVDFESQMQAKKAATFARAYVKKHGDIDLASFPWDLDTPYNFDDWEGRDPRPWNME